MTINKTIKMLTKEVSYNNGTETVTACTMHPITPHDLATILVKAGNNLDGIMKAWDKLEIPAVNPASGAKRTTEETAEILLDRAPEVIGLIAQYAPELIADIIAISARDPEEGVAQYIQENWSLPLQFDCLQAPVTERTQHMTATVIGHCRQRYTQLQCLRHLGRPAP